MPGLRKIAFTYASLCLLIVCRAFAQDEPTTMPVLPPRIDAPVSLLRSLQEKMWGEIYFQGTYSHRDRDNFIADTTVRQGLRTFKINGHPIEAYIKARLLYDLRSDFWNNIAEGGIGLRYRPFDKYGLVLFGEFLNGYYTGRHGINEPAEDSYFNTIGGFAFWQWWGAQPWAIEEGVHFYLPFTGWRETYTDGIFNHRDNDNFVTVASYKEGLLLGKHGGFNYDAYIAMGAATDVNGDVWNNHVRIGPGFSITPFEDVDLKLSCEYYTGYQYRGQNENDLGSYNDVVINIVFSKSW